MDCEWRDRGKGLAIWSRRKNGQRGGKGSVLEGVDPYPFIPWNSLFMWKHVSQDIIFNCCMELRERPYQHDSTTSRLLCEVKHVRARLVLRWGTTLESRVLFSFGFCLGLDWLHSSYRYGWFLHNHMFTLYCHKLARENKLPPVRASCRILLVV